MLPRTTLRTSSCTSVLNTIGRTPSCAADQIDLANRFNCLVNGGDKWHSHLTKFDAVELRHEAVTHGLCSNTRLVGNEEYGSFNHGNLFNVGASPQSVSLKAASDKQRTMKPYIIPFEKLKNKDVELVGGKNASIGEMISGLADLGVSVPGGFATTSHAYRDFLAQGGLDERIRAIARDPRCG